jgi:hypothetical protein
MISVRRLVCSRHGWLPGSREHAKQPPDGRVISAPRLSHPRLGLSYSQWRALGPAQKLERLFGMSLDDLFEIMSWPIGELDPFRLSVRIQATRVVFTVCLKAVLDGRLGREAARERDRERILAERLEGLRP